MRPFGSPEQLQRRRLRAIQLLDSGVRPVEVARNVGADRRSVRRWQAAYRREGEEALLAKPASGRPPKLTGAELDTLREMLLEGAQEQGYPTDLWTCRRVAHLIKKRFGVTYHPDHIGRLLRSLGFSPQKPQRRAVERNEEEIQRWVAEDWPRIKKTARRKAWLVFIDESGLLMAPLVRRTWSLKGQTPVFLQRAHFHKKVSAIAALCVSPDKQNVRLYFRLQPGESIGADLVLCFIKELDRQLDDPAVLVWDRLTAHRAKVVKEFMGASLRLDNFFLPPYTSELNPVEYLLSYLKTNSLANFAAFELNVLADATRKSGRSLQRKEYLLRSLYKSQSSFFTP